MISKGFTLIEVLVSLGILALIMGATMQIFTFNAKSLALIEERLLSQFVAENIMVSSFLFDEELYSSTGVSEQGNSEFFWKREIISEDGKSIQVKVVVANSENVDLYELISYKLIK